MMTVCGTKEKSVDLNLISVSRFGNTKFHSQMVKQLTKLDDLDLKLE